ncbi:MAG TPA: hypothetical protein VGU61_13085 [Noviherbaspirillum sp.]|uniref:hypothetical protein n=1 Tax=Noviherbaspirillum sp. TaxID=1926288 RepID=UPI002DDD3BE0|nr:hypothetical protein [Noviherbaspirillum sp.]HEV2611197.1 hypothetical protein [Noviherbaspirillum sp.]
MTNISGSMVPLSGRIEDELYQWFIALQYEGAKTNSDKLREALKELRAQHEGTSDFVTALSWFQRLTQSLRESLYAIERDEQAHSEVLTLLIEQITVMAAALLSSKAATKAEAAQIEEQLVRRAFAMTEALLRQAVTPSAAAIDTEVVRRHSQRTVDLAKLINLTQTGENNG